MIITRKISSFRGSVVFCAALAAASCGSKSSDKSGDSPEKVNDSEKKAAAEPGSSGAKVAPAQAGAQPAAAEPSKPAKPLPADTGAHQGSHIWSARFGSAKAETARGVVVTPDGGVAITGYLKGPVPLGGEKVADPQGADGYVARFAADGKLMWARNFGGKGDDTSDAIALTADGGFVVGGSFSEELVIGEDSLQPVGADDAFVVKFDGEGRRMWAKRYGGLDIDAVHDVAVDSKGNVFATGVYRDEMTIGGKVYTAQGESDIFLIKLSDKGELLWTKSYGELGKDFARKLAIDSQDNLAFLVEFSGAIDFGGGPVDSAGNRDIGVAKLTNDGEHIWSKQFGNDLDELAISLTVDPQGSVILTGGFDDVISFGGEKMRAVGRSDIFITKLDHNGVFQWSHRYGDDDEDIGADVVTDKFGNIFVTGWFWKEASFSGKPLKSAGKRDLFIAKLSPAGEHLWAKHFGAKESDFGRAIAITPDGSPVIAGSFYFTLNVGGADLVAPKDDKELVPRSDAFVAKFSR